MNAMTAALCKKPVLGIAMWLMTFCATNQALHEKYVDFGSSGVMLSEMFNVPMDEQYSLLLLLSPADLQNWRSLLCMSNSVTKPIDVSIRINDVSGKQYLAQTFQPSCQRPSFEEKNTLVLGVVQVKKGKYNAELVNNAPITALAGKRVQVLLMGKGAGYP